MSLAITATIGQLKDFIARAHRAIEALEDLEKVGVIPKGVVDYNPETKPNVKVTGIMKTCKKCGHIKPLDEFPKKPVNRDGHAGSCKECKKIYQRRLRQKTMNAASDLKLKFKCDICHAKFMTKAKLEEHSRERHAA